MARPAWDPGAGRRRPREEEEDGKRTAPATPPMEPRTTTGFLDDILRSLRDGWRGQAEPREPRRPPGQQTSDVLQPLRGFWETWKPESLWPAQATEKIAGELMYRSLRRPQPPEGQWKGNPKAEAEYSLYQLLNSLPAEARDYVTHRIADKAWSGPVHTEKMARRLVDEVLELPPEERDEAAKKILGEEEHVLLETAGHSLWDPWWLLVGPAQSAFEKIFNLRYGLPPEPTLTPQQIEEWKGLVRGGKQAAKEMGEQEIVEYILKYVLPQVAGRYGPSAEKAAKERPLQRFWEWWTAPETWENDPLIRMLQRVTIPSGIPVGGEPKR